jgi:Na+/melibiose symporter-like transporter
VGSFWFFVALFGPLFTLLNLSWWAELPEEFLQDENERLKMAASEKCTSTGTASKLCIILFQTRNQFNC